MTTSTASLALIPLAANMNELRLEGVRVLFSYSTPVACHLTDAAAVNSKVKLPSGGYCTDTPKAGYLRTLEKHSPTTSRHINKWLRAEGVDGVDSPEVSAMPQEFFDNLLSR